MFLVMYEYLRPRMNSKGGLDLKLVQPATCQHSKGGCLKSWPFKKVVSILDAMGQQPVWLNGRLAVAKQNIKNEMISSYHCDNRNLWQNIPLSL